MKLVNRLALLSLIAVLAPTMWVGPMGRCIPDTGGDAVELFDSLECFSCGLEINQSYESVVWCHVGQPEPHAHHELCLTQFDGAADPIVSCRCRGPLGQCVKQYRGRLEPQPVQYGNLCCLKAAIWRTEFGERRVRDYYKGVIIRAIAAMPDINLLVARPVWDEPDRVFCMSFLCNAIVCNAPMEVIAALLARPEIDVHLGVVGRVSKTPLETAIENNRRDVITALLAHPNFDARREEDVLACVLQKIGRPGQDLFDYAYYLNIARIVCQRQHPYISATVIAAAGAGTALLAAANW